MNFKFNSAVLPCNEKEDFNTKDPSLDIVCRIFLDDAPDRKHENIAKKIDGDNYDKTCFFIEAIIGKNEPNGTNIKSGWYLGYITYDDGWHEFGYVDDDIEGAWEFFENELGITI